MAEPIGGPDREVRGSAGFETCTGFPVGGRVLEPGAGKAPTCSPPRGAPSRIMKRILVAANSSGTGEETPLARSAREIVRVVLATVYRVPAGDAARLEGELLIWFDRLRRRPGAPSALEALRTQLVSMACRVAHIYWTGQAGQAPSADPRIERTLALGPDVVATEFEARLLEKGSGGKTEP